MKDRSLISLVSVAAVLAAAYLGLVMIAFGWLGFFAVLSTYVICLVMGFLFGRSK